MAASPIVRRPLAGSSHSTQSPAPGFYTASTDSRLALVYQSPFTTAAAEARLDPLGSSPAISAMKAFSFASYASNVLIAMAMKASKPVSACRDN